MQTFLFLCCGSSDEYCLSFMQTSPTAGSYITELTNGVSTQLYTHTNLDQIVEYHANITGESVVGLFSPSKQF